MQTSNRKNLLVGLAAGVGLTAVAGMLMGQTASQPVKTETQYFVTGEGDAARPTVSAWREPPAPKNPSPLLRETKVQHGAPSRQECRGADSNRRPAGYESAGPVENPRTTDDPVGSVSGFDPDLQAVIGAWADLPTAIRTGILAMVRAAAPPSSQPTKS